MIGAKSSLDMCGHGFTGNHYDPKYGCSSDSEYAGKVCKSVRPFSPHGIQSCNPKTDVSSCEIGDLSGKLGKMSLKKEPQKWDDHLAIDVKKYMHRSIVLHCCSHAGCDERIACAYLS